MACNETGNGALAAVHDIVHAVKEALQTVLEGKQASQAVEGNHDDNDDNVVHGLKGSYRPTTHDRKVTYTPSPSIINLHFPCFPLFPPYFLRNN